MSVTEAVMAALLIVAIIYDILAAILYGQSVTMSARTWALSKRYPILPLAVGILLGHLFWSQV